MKKFHCNFLSLIAVVAISAMMISSAFAAERIHLKHNLVLPSSHDQFPVVSDWVDEIEKQTGGQVVISIYASGELTSATEVFDSVVDGIADIGMSYFYNPGEFPVMDATGLPLGYPDTISASRIANDFYKQFSPDELKSVKVLYLHATGPTMIHTRNAVRSLDDLKGKKISASGVNNDMVNALGGVPIALPVSEIYTALKYGVIDGTCNQMDVLKTNNLAEVADYTTDITAIAPSTVFFVFMNKARWESLSTDIQNIFESVSNAWIDVHANRWDLSDAEGQAYAAGLGHEIVQLSADQVQLWKESVQPVINDYIDEVTTKGFAGQSYVDWLNTALLAYSSRPPPTSLKVSISGVTVNLQWESVPGALGYVLYAAPAPYTGPETIGSADMGMKTGLSGDLWPGASYYVAVTARNGNGESDYSNIELVTIEDVKDGNTPSTYTNSLGQTFDLIPPGTFTILSVICYQLVNFFVQFVDLFPTA